MIQTTRIIAIVVAVLFSMTMPAGADTSNLAKSWGWTHSDDVVWAGLVKTYPGCYLAEEIMQRASSLSTQRKRDELPPFAGGLSVCINEMLKDAPAVSDKNIGKVAGFAHLLATPRRLLAATCATIKRQQGRVPRACNHWYSKLPSPDE